MFSRALTVSAVLSLAAAQLSVSPQCTSALTSIATSSDAITCLVPSPLLSLFTDSTQSIITPIDNWLKGACAAPACSNSTLAAIVQNVTTGCSAELQNFGLSGNTDSAAVTSIVQQFYPTVRQTVCLNDGSTNCITQTLTNIQNTLGEPLTLQNILALSQASSVPNIPANVTCTNCIKAMFNEVNGAIPGLFGTTSDIQNQCGASFTNGQQPAGITESASNAVASNSTTTNNNGAGYSSPLSLGAFSGASVVIALGLLVGA